MSDFSIVAQTNKLFIRKRVDMNNDVVLASVITAASEMSTVSDLEIQKEVVIEQLLDIYNKSNNEMVSSLVGMDSSFVNRYIGFCVNFKDYKIARLDYENKKDIYDRYYGEILERSKAKENVSKKI